MLGGLMRVTGQVRYQHYHENSTIETRSLSGALTDFERNPYAFAGAHSKAASNMTGRSAAGISPCPASSPAHVSRAT